MSTRGQEDAPSPPEVDPMLACLRELDEELGGFVTEMEAQRPDLFATFEDRLQYIEAFATLAGKREILNFLMEKFGPKSE